jgi:peptidoglycan/xylan/chitin deacetylase (PgdA/CDA1 family)
VLLSCGVIVAGSIAASAEPCANPNALGTSRTLVVDPTEHPLIGSMQYRETLPLHDHEVVITFDDGPLPPNTGRILDILAAECVKANYFMVGRMAQVFPKWVQRVAAAGHTIGTHSQNHPLSFHKMPLERAEAEINDGIASVKAALGHDPAPFFRIPGLLRIKRVEDYLISQHIQTWSADFPADDWKHISDKEVLKRALTRLEAHGKGILLLHDIHPNTAAMLPILLHELKVRGYHIVHVVPAGPGLPKTVTTPDQWRMHPLPPPTTVEVAVGEVPGVPAPAQRNVIGAPFGPKIALPLRLDRTTLASHQPAILRGTHWPNSSVFLDLPNSAPLPVPDRRVFTAPFIKPSIADDKPRRPRTATAMIAIPVHQTVVEPPSPLPPAPPAPEAAATPASSPSILSTLVDKIRQQMPFF